MGDQLKELLAAGQSIWLDNIRRNMFASGELKKMIDDGLRGMTSNPTIFEKAIGAGTDYDGQLMELVGRERDPQRLFEALAIDDIRHACDLFRPLFDATGGADGFVSLEVSPLLARDTQGTIDAAKRLWKEVDRPNVMIKIPGTAEGVPAIKASIAAGINVNVTLLFGVERYAAAATAYIEGVEERVSRGEPVDHIASVASVFVSRIDSAVDKLLETRIAKGEKLEALLGKAGIANLKIVYQKFKTLFENDRFAKLRAKGAHVQRPLWASTSTKNPAYPDLMYVENLVGRDTVNTLPPQTYVALLDHGRIRLNTVEEGLPAAHATLEALSRAQISLYDVTEKLVEEGVKSFADSYGAMLKAIEYKQQRLAEGRGDRVRFHLNGAQSASDSALAELASQDFLKKLWAKDPSPWSNDPAHVAIIKNALGWVAIPDALCEAANDLRSFAAECAKRFTHVVVLGMGGSSLAPDIMRATFGKIDGYPQLHVLDSTAPVQIKNLEDSLDLQRTLFIVASKSGTTTEPDAFFRYFYERVQKVAGAENAAGQFIAITDSETKLNHDAQAMGFLRIFTNAPDIGGRYSALSYFGMVPAALAGYDVGLLLDRATGAMHANDKSVRVDEAPAVRFGAAIGSLAKNGRDKLTIVTHPAVAAFGAWCEQLIAESTGKSGTGIIPVEGEPLGDVDDYANDRIFVYVGAGLPDPDPSTEPKLEALERAGHPVIRLEMHDRYDLGEQFYTWEVATAAAGAILHIDAFDQPNVQESKDNTKRLLAEFARDGQLPEPQPRVTTAQALVIPLAGSKNEDFGNDLNSAIAAICKQITPGDYVAMNVYLAMIPYNENFFRDLRVKIRDAYDVATTVGFGPRFLHSTGQLHKGGPNSGVFLQITGDPPLDLEIPGMVKFGTLMRAQALGDFESLDRRNRRGARIHIVGDVNTGLQAIAQAIDDAVKAGV